MRVRALKSFAGMVDGAVVQVRAGSEMELPEGVDWLQAGFVAVVDTGTPAGAAAPHLQGVETAVVKPAAEKRKKG
jgi:hypothetical protein